MISSTRGVPSSGKLTESFDRDEGMLMPDVPLRTGQAESSARPDDDIGYLCGVLGNVFVEWVLVNSNTMPSAAQLEVAGALADLLKGYAANNPGVPIEFMGSWLAFYHEQSGTTFINYCRRYAGGSTEVPKTTSTDRLLTASLAFAAECYGEMLLPTHMGRSAPDFHRYVKTDAGKNFVQAIYDEGIFRLEIPNDPNALEGTAVYVRSIIPGMYASGLIWCAWNLAKLDAAYPTLPQLAAKIPVALEQLRSCLSGQETKVASIASFTGVRLPNDAEISGAWGRLRPARAEDHPSTLRRFTDKRTTTTTETGDKIEISDAGDVIFETNVSIRMQVSDGGTGWSTEAVEDLGELIDKVRLSFALAVTRPTKPIIYTMWTTTLFPFGGMQPFPLTDPQFMAPRTPTLLTEDEIGAWSDWIGILTSADMSRLKVAMTRTLRAMTERQDPNDRLIDAVIAWESLFGATNESTLRVSSSLARLLHPSGERREVAQKSYQKCIKREAILCTRI